MMNRRKAIKGLGLSLGAIVATPTVLSLLQSCTTEEVWMPQFYTEDQGRLVGIIVDIILPKTEDSPSATEVNVPQFIDRYISEVDSPESQERMKLLAVSFEKMVLASSGASSLKKVKAEDIEPIIAKLLKKTNEEHYKTMGEFGKYAEALAKGENPTANEDVLAYVFLDGIRGGAIWAYKNSEFVGENVLAYAPIPGQQQGCISVADATGGKAWAM